MGTDSISMASTAVAGNPVAAEVAMLELFAPTSRKRAVQPGSNAPLWRSDAIHRAKNMAQMTTSLARMAEHPSRDWLPMEVAAQARSLSRIYDELGDGGDPRERMPCALLLTEVATRLTHIFGRVRHVATRVAAEPVMLPRDRRRALVLMCSEMVINALKYGFPAEMPGTISVALTTTPLGIELVVEDDGVGIVGEYSPGKGGGLLDRLADVVGAAVRRTAGGSGHGFRVSALLPASAEGAGG